MVHVDQSRSFQQRLGDFGPELGAFLGRVWQQRAAINLNDFDAGVGAIYELYSGPGAARRYNRGELTGFVQGLLRAAGGYKVYPQGFRAPLSAFSDAQVRVYGRDLWTDFFHVLSTPNPANAIRSRVYVHAANASASIRLMEVIIGEFGRNRGLWEAKTAGPGAQRLDTIVSYHYDAASADQLVKTLEKTAAVNAGLFVDSLPPLVKRAGHGIGVADEPPAIEVYSQGGTRHSFGSFFSTLCWIALKTTPDVGKPTADGRHMLDNVLYALRTLRIDPKNPQRFPEAATLEAWFRAAHP